MTITFDRKLEKSTELDLFKGIKKKKELIAKATLEILKDPSRLQQIRYSLLAHADRETKFSLSGVDASLESALKKGFRTKKQVLKGVGKRDVKAITEPKGKRKRDGEPDEDEPDQKREAADEEEEEVTSTQVEPTEAEEPTEPEEPVTTTEAIEEEKQVIDITKLPEEVLTEYTEVGEKGDTLPAGAEPYEETKEEEGAELGDLKTSVPEDTTGTTVREVAIDNDFDNGGQDIRVIDNGGELVRRQIFQDIINQMQTNDAFLLAQDMELEFFKEEEPLEAPQEKAPIEPTPTEEPISEEQPTEEEPVEETVQDVEMTEKVQEEPIPEKPDVEMKMSRQEKKAESKRQELANLREKISARVAKSEAEFNQAMAGTFMIIKGAREGLFLNLKESKALKKELQKETAQQKEFVKERLKLQESEKNKRILELRLNAAADTASSSMDIYQHNIKKIKDKINANPANRSLIVSSYRDPDTFNEIKYLTDANGDLVLNEATGAPYIESISAMKRDDAAKLLKQRRAVDGTDLPSPYYPMYGKQTKEFFSKHEYSFLGRQFAKGKKLASLQTHPNIKGRIKELLNLLGSSMGIEDTSIRSDSFKQWVELETLKNSYDNYTSSADYQYEQDKLDLDQDGNLTDENAMASAAKILQNITAQQLIKALSAGQTQLQQQEEQVRAQPTQQPAEPIADKGQDEGPVEEGQMDVQKDPEQVRQESVNLSQWASTSSNAYNPPFRGRVFEPTNFPAFGGEDTEITEGIWV